MLLCRTASGQLGAGSVRGGGGGGERGGRGVRLRVGVGRVIATMLDAIDFCTAVRRNVSVLGTTKYKVVPDSCLGGG